MVDPNGDGQQNPPHGNEDPTANVSRVTIKVPPFWHESPEIWFAQVEAQFAITGTGTGTTTDTSKFNTVLGHIESRILTQVTEAVLNPPANGKYENLKQQILKRFTDTEHKKMSKLLSEMPLGDRKPSHLLNEMKLLGGANVTEEFLKTLWLQNLPEQTRVITSASTGDLTALAELADKVYEVSNAGKINELSNASASSNQSKSTDSHSSLERKIDAMTKAIQSLFRDDDKFSRSRSRSKSRNQKRDSTPSASKDKKGDDICWYHRKFGNKADNCSEPVKPCNFKSKN